MNMRKTNIDTPKEIEFLLHRFMDGQTSLDEEERLARYFRHADVPEEWEAYRQMFAYFDEGMPLNTDSGTQHRPHSHRRALWTALAAAAAIALTVVMTLPQQVTTLPDTAELTPIAQSDSATTQPNEATNDTINTPNTPNAPQQQPRRRSYYKHKYEPAPPKTYYAHAASADDKAARAEADQLVNEQLNMMELKQQVIMLVGDNKTLPDNPQSLLATSDDADDYQEAN